MVQPKFHCGLLKLTPVKTFHIFANSNYVQTFACTVLVKAYHACYLHVLMASYDFKSLHRPLSGFIQF